jgi:CheY-like chemotaxis protein
MPRDSDGCLILVVDDDPIVRQLLARMLADAGYPVLLAGDGKEGLAVAATVRARLGLVVTDIRMPIMDGPTMVAQLELVGPRLPALFISGFTTMVDSAALPGPVLNKPFTSSTLLEEVRRLLDARGGAALPA